MTEQAGRPLQCTTARLDSFCIDPAHPSLAGHFPGNPVVPGVLLLDHVMTAIESTHGAGCAIRLPQIKFLRPLLPGEQAQIVLEDPVPVGAVGDLVSNNRHFRIRFRVEHDDLMVASGEVVMAVSNPTSTMARAT